MRFLNTYRLFESVDDSDVSDNIQDCVDYLETFHEFEDDYLIEHMKRGYNSNSGNRFYTGDQLHESDKLAFQFYFRKKNSSFGENIVENRPLKITLDNINEIIDMLNKSKSFLKKFEMWSNDVRMEVFNTQVKFLIIFENIEDVDLNEIVTEKD